MIDKDLLAQYGQACVELEIMQNKHMELKRKIAEVLKASQATSAPLEGVKVEEVKEG